MRSHSGKPVVSVTPKGQHMIYPVVLAGLKNGTEMAEGAMIPAHFCAAGPGASPFQSVLRGLDHPMFAAPTVVACAAQRFVAVQQMEAVGATGEVLVEPCQSKSAALMAALALRFQHDPEALLLILPAEHVDVRNEAFRRAIENAMQIAFGGNLVLLTGEGVGSYGHVRALSRVRGGQPVQALFSATAADHPDDPQCFESAGVYLVRAGSLLSAFKRHAPRLLQATKRAVEGMQQGAGFLRLAPDAYGRVKAESFETAVLSRMQTVVAISPDGPLESTAAETRASVEAWRTPMNPAGHIMVDSLAA